MQIIIDIDGTICTEERQFSRPMATSLPGAVESVNALFDAGHIIILYSSRTWAEWEVTNNWLREKGMKFHQLFLGKPVGDVWIDDRAIRHVNWDQTLEELEELEK